jgi:peptide/nickel transport system ATP-binding protein
MRRLLDKYGLPAGCRFHPRCQALASGEADDVADACRGTALPILPADPEGHRCACHLVAARGGVVPTDANTATDPEEVSS